MLELCTWGTYFLFKPFRKGEDPELKEVVLKKCKRPKSRGKKNEVKRKKERLRKKGEEIQTVRNEAE